MPKKKKTLLSCTDCLIVNYSVNKSDGIQETRLEVKKFCKRCGKHTLHKEQK